MTNEQAIIKALSPYLTAYPENKLDEASLIVYARALSDIPAEVVDVAMLKLVRTAKFFPRIADIIGQVKELGAYAAKSKIPDADEAWREVMREAHDKFVYGKWELSCPEVQQAVDNFGKMALCELKPEELNTARAQFRDIYNSVTRRAKGKREAEEVFRAISPNAMAQLIAYACGEAKRPVLQAAPKRPRIDSKAV